MQQIVDTVRKATGTLPAYPDERFVSGFAPPDPSLLLEQQDANKPGERPGKQRNLRQTPIDDIYANGKPYVGSGKLEGKTAIITGGDSGIGRATAILFAMEGATSTITFLPAEQKDAEDVRDYIKQKTGKETNLFPADLKAEAMCKAVVDNHIQKFKSVDILFNNAAQQLENHDLTTLDSKQWEDCFQLNIHAYFYMVKAAVPHMPRGSAIINNASINAYVGRDDLLDYTSTKGAIVSFTRGVSNQLLGSKQIRSNAIAPGPIYTPLISSTFSKSNLLGINAPPISRPGQPVEIASVAVFLASEDSSYVSGTTIHVNGGTIINS